MAKIQIVWPHGSKPVLEAELANITAYLFLDDALNPVDCSYDPVVRLWMAEDKQPGRVVALGEKRLITRDNRTFAAWDFNDIDVSAAQDPTKKLYFFVTVDGVETRRNVWAHAANVLNFNPRPDPALGVVGEPINPVDAKIEVVWPQGLPVEEATRADISGVLFEPGSLNAVSEDSPWQPQVALYSALNTGVDGGSDAAVVGEPRTVLPGSYRAWGFNDVDVSAARQSGNRIYFWLDVAGVDTQPNIWTYGEDGPTIFPEADLPARNCR